MIVSHIYFDNAATTPLDPRVMEAMELYGNVLFGNPSSLHAHGRLAREAVELARRSVAWLINAEVDEIYFTSSGTEANNLALLGAPQVGGRRIPHIVTSSIEHPAVLETARALMARGTTTTFLPADPGGIVGPEKLEEALTSETGLVSIMAANNVTGVVQPIEALARIAKKRPCLFHTDAVQALGRIPIDVKAWNVDMMTLSAHKIYGPKGVGALFIRRGLKLEPLLFGGGQERGLRPSTENVAGIAGFGKAAELVLEEMSEDACRLVRLRDAVIDKTMETVPEAYLIGDRYRRLPGHACFGFAGKEGEAIRILLALDEAGISISSGAACSASHSGEAAAALLGMGFDPIRARGSLRVSLGRFNTETEVEKFLKILPSVVAPSRSQIAMEKNRTVHLI